MTVAAVGAGLEGLAAARELRADGHEVAVVAGGAVTGASFGGVDHPAVFGSGVWAARRLTAAFVPAAW